MNNVPWDEAFLEGDGWRSETYMENSTSEMGNSELIERPFWTVSGVQGQVIMY